MRSLVLIGRGSHRSGEAASAVFRQADTLRAQGLYDEVIEAFWQEEPSLRQVLRTAASTEVTVVPMFLAEGYFTDTVLPRELGLGHQGPVPEGGVARVLGNRTVRYTRPYGTHPAMTDLILTCARDALPGADLQDVAVVVLGTGRSNSNCASLHDHVERLRAATTCAEVHALFLHDVPGDWAHGIQAAQVVVVPFLAAQDEAGQTALRTTLGLPPEGDSPGAPGERMVHLAAAVGSHAGVADVLRRVAQDALHAAGRDGDVDRTHEAAWQALRHLAQRGGRLGEVMVTPHAGVFELRHALDEGLPGADLHTVVSPEGLRDVTRTDAAGTYRPVRTYRTLPRGWRAVLSAQDLRRGVHNLYPAAVEEAYAHACHALRHTPWATTARRQTGADARVQRATPDVVERVAGRVCAPCLRTPLWLAEKLPRTFLDGVPGALPCAEACTLMIAAVRDEVGGPALSS